MSELIMFLAGIMNGIALGYFIRFMKEKDNG